MIKQNLNPVIFGLTEFLPLSANGSLLAYQKLIGQHTLPLDLMGQLACGTLLGSFFFWLIRKGYAIFGDKRVNYFPFLLCTILPVGGAFAIALPRWIALPPTWPIVLLGHTLGLIATVLIFKKYQKRSWQATPGQGLTLGVLQSLQVFPGCDRQALALLYFRLQGFEFKPALLYSLWTLFPLLALNTVQGFIRFELPNMDVFLTNILGAALCSYLALDLAWRASDRWRLIVFLGYRLGLLALTYTLF